MLGRLSQIYILNVSPTFKEETNDLKLSKIFCNNGVNDFVTKVLSLKIVLMRSNFLELIYRRSLKPQLFTSLKIFQPSCKSGVLSRTCLIIK